MWGPSHQNQRPPGFGWGWRRIVTALVVLAVAFELWAHRLPKQGLRGATSSTFHTMLVLAIVFGALQMLWRFRPQLLASLGLRRPTVAERLGVSLCNSLDPAIAVRTHALSLGGGAVLGVAARTGWVTASREHAVLVLGPPRSGKTSAVAIPALLAASSAAVSTSTKRDVLDATWRVRAGFGQVWLFDPAEAVGELPPGVRRLSWSPVAAASSWDEALLIARAMGNASSVGRGTTNESHWRERSGALLAPLLLAGNLAGLTVGDVLGWVLRHDLDPAKEILTDADEPMGGDVLAGIGRTEGRERSSILSATAGVLSAYNASAARRAAAKPNFDPVRFVTGTDTVYIAAPAHLQAQCAPLIVGLLEQIRHATYAHRLEGCPPVFMCLDELANIAPIHDLPALVSEAGGQGLHVLACLQDLSQARQRWGDSTADGLLSLFQTKLVLDGIADSRTLESLSLTVGEYDRQLVSRTVGVSEPRPRWFARDEQGRPSRSESVTYSTSRQRVLSPGEIAGLPAGRGLLLRGARWQLIELTPWYRCEPWRTLSGI